MRLMKRRDFLRAGLAAGAAVAVPLASGRAWGANEAIRLGFIGCGGRANALLTHFTRVEGVRVGGLCDPDQSRLHNTGKRFPDATQCADLRKMLEDDRIDVVVLATAVHWHALATIWALEAGKDVYCEKPMSHNLRETRLAAAAIAKSDRIWQHGTQQQSDPMRADIRQFLHEEQVVGIVVSGFGVAPVYAAPLASWLIGRFGLSTAIVILGTGFLLVVTGLAQLLKTPPPGYVPPGTVPQPVAAGPQRKESYPPREMLKTWQFYTMWFMYACGAGAGLMIISKLAEIAMVQAGLEMGFVLVAALGVGNGGGRIITGVLSDKIGRKATLLMCFVLQAVLILLLSQTTEGSWLASAGVLSVVSALIGANFGANLALFPSMTKDYFGLAHFGMNYGLLFTAWGFGGFLLALLAGKVYDVTGSFNFAYYSSAALLVGAAIATILIKPPYHLEEEPAV